MDQNIFLPLPPTSSEIPSDALILSFRGFNFDADVLAILDTDDVRRTDRAKPKKCFCESTNAPELFGFRGFWKPVVWSFSGLGPERETYIDC